MRLFTSPLITAALCTAGLSAMLAAPSFVDASSHREAPLISNDPLADNTDVYAFRTPDNPETVTIVANYIPFQLPEGGPNYNTFGENVRYEIHVKNKTSVGVLGTATDDLTYRFTFSLTNEDPTTFFNIRLGKQNLKATYTVERSVNGGPFTSVLTGGIVPPNNIGPRSIEGAAGLATTYTALENAALMQLSTGERVFAGPRDDPFFVDLGGVFDLGGVRNQFTGGAQNPNAARDGVAGLNVHSIVLQIPISTLQKDGKAVAQATTILDPDFVIGVWASASRTQTTTLSTDGSAPTVAGPWVQVSRLGMPLTNEAIVPIGMKDRWNATSPYAAREQDFATYFANPELGLYMAEGTEGPNTYYGAAVPGLAPLRIQKTTYPALGDTDGNGRPGLDFRNGQDGAYALLPLIQNGSISLANTAFAVPTAPRQPGLPTALIGDNEPRRLDILPIFYFGVPNAIPYQLATGKTAGPLSAGKPFIHNFLPITQTPTGDLYGGDMLRLNMATPVTPRGTSEYTTNARMGLIRAAAIGLTASPFNTNKNLEAIPHMDGFPNGRRLEDDVTTIELQAVGGLVLAAVGLPFDDATSPAYADLASPALVAELTFVAGPTANDMPFLSTFPYLARPHRGYDYVKQLTAAAPPVGTGSAIGVAAPEAMLLEQNAPNPFEGRSRVNYRLTRPATVRLEVFDVRGRRVQTLVDRREASGTYNVDWDATELASGTYFYRLSVDGRPAGTRQAVVVR